MKLLVLSQYWHPEQGVPQRRWQWLVETMIKHGAEVLVIAPPPHYKREQSLKMWLEAFKGLGSPSIEWGPSGERILRCPFLPTTKSLTNRVINQLVIALGMLLLLIRKESVPRAFKPDLVVGTVPALPTAAVTFVFSRVLRVPYLIDLRDPWPDLLHCSDHWNRELGVKSIRQKALERGPKQWLFKLVETVLWFVYGQADAMIFTSEYLQKSVTRRLKAKRGRKPDSLLIRNVFPTPVIVKNSRENIGNKKGEQVLRVLYAGTVGRAQNLNNLLAAIEIAARNGTLLDVRIVGSGAALPYLKEVWQNLGLPIEFTGNVAPSKTREYYEWADCAVVHLAEWDALKSVVPSKTYELMELQKPILAVAAGETAALIEGLQAGIVIQPNCPDELAALFGSLQKNKDKISISAQARAWVQKERLRVETEVVEGIIEKYA